MSIRLLCLEKNNKYCRGEITTFHHYLEICSFNYNRWRYTKPTSESEISFKFQISISTIFYLSFSCYWLALFLNPDKSCLPHTMQVISTVRIRIDSLLYKYLCFSLDIKHNIEVFGVLVIYGDGYCVTIDGIV